MKTQSALINPVKLPEDLNEAERHFVQCMAEGEPCIFEENHSGRSGKNANVIRAEVIGFFARGGDNDHLMRGDIIHLHGARISDELNLLHADIRVAISLLYCHITDKISFAYAKCPGLRMCGSHLSKGLHASGLVSGMVALNQGFVSKDMVNLADAKVGELDCSDSHFDCPETSEYAFVASGINVSGKAHFQRARINGSVHIAGAYLGGLINFKNSTLRGDLFLGASEVRGGLLLQEVRGSGVINLGFTKTSFINDSSTTHENFKFKLQGFTYQSFITHEGHKARIKWLKSYPKSDEEYFTPQPFEQAAKVLFAMGHDTDARKVLLEKEKLLTEHGNMSDALKWLRRWWDRLAGYGYQLWKTLAWSAAIIAAGACLFDYADDACHIVPSQPAVVVSEKYMNAQTHKCAVEGEPTKATVRLFPEYSEFQPLAYSVDVFFPFFALHQEPYWEPKSKEGYPEILPHILRLWFRLEVAAGWLHQEPYQDPKSEENLADIGLYFLRFWFWLEIALGWFLTSLAVLSITGLLRPRQSSGDKE